MSESEPQKKPYKQSVVQTTVKYFAVYPGGRRCEVSKEAIEKNHAEWCLNDGVFIETDLVYETVPTYGTVRLINLADA